MTSKVLMKYKVATFRSGGGISDHIIDYRHDFDRKIYFQVYQSPNIYFQQQSNSRRKMGVTAGQDFLKANVALYF